LSYRARAQYQCRNDCHQFCHGLTSAWVYPKRERAKTDHGCRWPHLHSGALIGRHVWPVL
jgi:hypothetical protein